MKYTWERFTLFFLHPTNEFQWYKWNKNIGPLFILFLFFISRYSQNILMLREQVDTTQRHLHSLGGEPQRTDPLREEQVKELQLQLKTLRAKMHQMETLEKSFSETKRQLEVRDGLYSSSFLSTIVKKNLPNTKTFFHGFTYVGTEDAATRRSSEKAAGRRLARSK